ncbi:pyrroloquinoline quinone biosynthesis protein PqqB [Paracoccus sp. R12_1]|uniref:pyrroloquinoline quinone biosynthesis protein PqqB n=1 Tax=unclassified Paracoccus (in: a-proteobacteria) TaxID=2688777 RepID=UPI001ADBE639|nr:MULTISPECIES: pyrroloquinoline quinone biosynthesis protein PqqB [unclassified Paracoccus (in: a-proteobacteria)]MBO9456077.1 pyrroloquinoline quinone biosynthesis protein PqqB [Paracoccus sp. R12_2]MBO9487106.1 pyrroloquinoline quinone biosynthesis protein PqqB [Paracoccus sp. R12_1]
MHIIILGAAAGGGLPQWNCGCRNCDAARAGRIPSLTQSSIAVSADGRDWAILNASPDIRMQLAATPALHPTGPRDMPLRAVLLTNGDIDHVAGLLTLRESQPFDLFATAAIHDALAQNPMLAALQPDLVPRRTVALDQAIDLAPGLTATLFAVPGKVPLYQEGEVVETGLMGEATVGVELAANGRRALYIPGCAEMPDWLTARIKDADALLFDGTLWQDDEMIRAGLGRKTGRRMGHMAASETIAALDGVPVRRRIFVHMNNSNPLTDPDSAETARAEAQGWQIGRDGMEITL